MGIKYRFLQGDTKNSKQESSNKLKTIRFEEFPWRTSLSGLKRLLLFFEFTNSRLDVLGVYSTSNHRGKKIKKHKSVYRNTKFVVSLFILFVTLPLDEFLVIFCITVEPRFVVFHVQKDT